MSSLQTNLLGTSVRITNPKDCNRKWENAVGIIVTAMLCGAYHNNDFYTVLFRDGSLVDFKTQEFKVRMDKR